MNIETKPAKSTNITENAWEKLSQGVIARSSTVFLTSAKRYCCHVWYSKLDKFITTGLKFDLFGVHSSIRQRYLIYGLPDRHWLSEKTAHCLVSMLHHAIDNVMVVSHGVRRLSCIQIHAARDRINIDFCLCICARELW